MPLQQSLGICEGSFLCRDARSWKKEDLCADLSRFWSLRIVFPKRRRFRFKPIHDDQPLQFPKAFPVQPGIWTAGRGILAEHEVSVDFAAHHALKKWKLAVIAVDPRQPIKTEIIGGLSRGTVISLQQTHHHRLHLRPIPRIEAFVVDVSIEVFVMPFDGWLRQVAGQKIVQGWNVRAALNRAVAAHRHDHASGAADVPEQLLQNSGSPNNLRSSRVLRPSDSIDDRRRPLAAAVAAQQFSDTFDIFGLAAAYVRNHLRRVARIVLAEQVQHAVRIAERGILQRTRHGGTAALRRMCGGATH